MRLSYFAKNLLEVHFNPSISFVCECNLEVRYKLAFYD